VFQANPFPHATKKHDCNSVDFNFVSRSQELTTCVANVFHPSPTSHSYFTNRNSFQVISQNCSLVVRNFAKCFCSFKFLYRTTIQELKWLIL